MKVITELLLYRRLAMKPKNVQPRIIKTSSTDDEFQWRKTLQANVNEGPIILVSQNDPHPGLLGFINCIQYEPNTNDIRCVIIMYPNSPKFNLDEPTYAEELKRGLRVNILQNSGWGTYRFLNTNLTYEEHSGTDHVYADVKCLGDLSSFDWFTVPLQSTENSIDVHFSGVRSNGDRVMGMVQSGAMASRIKPTENLTWTIPQGMSLRDASTIPMVYVTVYYAFFFHRRIAAGDSILIHAGSGGIGLAAIRVALAYGLGVFTTVSTPENKRFIMKTFSQLKGENIGNSRDCSFERMVMNRSNSRGVDFVLNSLSGDELIASIRCLAEEGRDD